MCKLLDFQKLCLWQKIIFIKIKLANIVERTGGLFLDCLIHRLLLKELQEAILPL